MNRPHLSQIPSRVSAALLLIVLSVHAAFAGSAFSKIVVFGDSINDFSNMVQFTAGVFPAPPSYAYGRQSNGPVWVEYVARQLNLQDHIVNYAVAGALTQPTLDLPTGNVWSDTFPGLEGTDVSSQVMDFLRDANGAADPAALYILEGGSNDFARVPNPAVIVANLIQSLVTLETKGAKHIILANLPDLGKTPRVILGEQLGLLPPGTAAYVSIACAQLNQALVAALPAYTFPGATVTIADTYGFIDRAAADPSAAGFVEVRLPFLLFGNGGDPDRWLFWDDLHPTTRGHQIFAAQVIESLVRSYSPGNGKVGVGQVNSLNRLVHADR